DHVRAGRMTAILEGEVDPIEAVAPRRRVLHENITSRRWAACPHDIDMRSTDVEHRSRTEVHCTVRARHVGRDAPGSPQVVRPRVDDVVVDARSSLPDHVDVVAGHCEPLDLRHCARKVDWIRKTPSRVTGASEERIWLKVDDPVRLPEEIHVNAAGREY